MLSKAMVTGGWAIVTLSLGTLASGFPTAVRSHWQWLVAATVVGVFVAIWGNFLKRSEHEPSVKQETHGNGSPAVSATDSGRAAAGDFIENQTIDNSTSTTGGVSAGSVVGHQIGTVNGPVTFPPSPPSISPVKQLRKLKIIKAEPTVAAEDGTLWTESLHRPVGDIVWVLRVLNPPPSADNPDAMFDRHICATLNFESENGETGYVERAFWLSDSGRTINMDAGQSKSILLGLYGNGRWAFYNNENESDFRVVPRKRVASPQSRKRMPQKNISLPSTLQVHIFSERSHLPLAEGKYRIFRKDGEDLAIVEEIV